MGQINRLEATAVPRLQAQWVEYIQGLLQKHDDAGDSVSGLIVGLRGPAWIVARCAVVVALAVVGLLAVEIVRVVGVTRTCTIVLPSGSEQSR